MIIKTIVTDSFKQQMTEQLRQAVQKIESSRQELDQQGRRYLSELENRDPAQVETFRSKLERQVRKQDAVRAKLVEELSTVEKLNPGTEYEQGTLEGLAEIRVGDRLSEKLQTAEIVVKDGLVVELRHY